MSITQPVLAATILLLRDFAGEIQVFMQQRSYQASFVGGAYVFPGGKVDPSDYQFPLHYLSLPEPDVANILFQKPNAQISAIAAIRECFEEARVLLAYDEHGNMLSLDTQSTLREYENLRNLLNNNTLSFEALCQTKKLCLALDQLVFLGHWITPQSSAQRFDTLFFAAHMPALQEGIHDDYESIHSVWWSAQQALEKYQRGEIQLITPTVKSLEHIKQFKNAQDFMAHQALGLTVLGR